MVSRLALQRVKELQTEIEENRAELVGWRQIGVSAVLLPPACPCIQLLQAAMLGYVS